MGGFDEAFALLLTRQPYILRLAQTAPHDSAIVTLAQVHHGFAASPARNGSVPRTLSSDWASLAVFLRKFMGGNGHPTPQCTRAHQRAAFSTYRSLAAECR